MFIGLTLFLPYSSHGMMVQEHPDFKRVASIPIPNCSCHSYLLNSLTWCKLYSHDVRKRSSGRAAREIHGPLIRTKWMRTAFFSKIGQATWLRPTKLSSPIEVNSTYKVFATTECTAKIPHTYMLLNTFPQLRLHVAHHAFQLESGIHWYTRRWVKNRNYRKNAVITL